MVKYLRLMHHRYRILPLLLAFLLSGALAVPIHAQELVFSQDGRSVLPSIQRTDGRATSIVVGSEIATNVRDVAVNPLNGTLYWTDSGDPSGFSVDNSTIRRSNPDGSNAESFLASVVEDPRGIALDVDNGKVYWADAFASEVARANLDGTGHEVLVNRLNRPVDVALDLVNGKIYWAEDGFSVARVQRANLDGTNVEDVATGFDDVLTVAVDPSGGKVYWVGNDGSGDSMRRADLDGANPETIIASVSQFARNLEVAPENGKLYWTVGTSPGTIQVSNLDGSNQQEFLNTGSNSAPRGLALVTPDAVASQAVSSSTGSSPIAFANTGVSIAFSNVSGSGTVTVTRYATPPQSTEGIPSEAAVSQYRIVIQIDGATFGSGTQVRFDTGSFPGINAPSDVEIYTRTTAVTGSFTPLTTTLDGTELVADVTGFSEFVFTSTNPDNTLPVEMNGFTATADDGGALLRWQTASEANNAGFYVERRTAQDGAWTSIGYEIGAGTTAQPQSYRFRDAALPFEAASVDYRLRQVDLDGTETLLSPVTLQVGTPATLQLHPTSPNPARSQVTVRYELPTSGDARLDVYNVLGQRVRSVDASIETVGRREITLSTSGMASGVYFVRLTQDGSVQTQRFTVVR